MDALALPATATVASVPGAAVSEDGAIREVKPVTSDDVPKVLHSALSDAVAGKLRGVVVLMAYHGGGSLVHLSGGTIHLSEVSLLVDHWKFRHFLDQAEGR